MSGWIANRENLRVSLRPAISSVMVSRIDLGALKDLGYGVPAPENVVLLYQQAFREFGVRALWNVRRLEQPTIAQVLAVSESLRTEGNLEARRLAVRIEDACRAAL